MRRKEKDQVRLQPRFRVVFRDKRYLEQIKRLQKEYERDKAFWQGRLLYNRHVPE